MSQVTCHMSHFFFFGQSGEAYWWRVCYQRGLPPSSFKSNNIYQQCLQIAAFQQRYSKGYCESPNLEAVFIFKSLVCH